MLVYETNVLWSARSVDCTRSIKLPGKSLADELDIPREDPGKTRSKFVDIGRLKLNRRKQQQGLESLKNLLHNGNDNVKPVFAKRCWIRHL